jgi:signal transduction histidine kinase
MSSSEQLVPGQGRAHDNGKSIAQSALCAILLDPALWYESLQNYARATGLAVALTDAQGGLLGECLNPQPTWHLLQTQRAAVVPPSQCPFSLVSRQPCTCIANALSRGRVTWARDRTRLVHFAVPLILHGQQLGAVLAGQVFDQYPEQIVLTHVAKQLGLSPDVVWQKARLECPIKRDTLYVYADLLVSLSQTFLQARYDAIQEAERLAEMTELRDQAEQAHYQALQAEEALQHAYAELEQRVQERTTALYQEMTERQRLEREAERDQHFALLGRLAAGVSHEIRNPLATIALNVDLLEEELHQPSPEGAAEVAEAFTEIKTNLARLDDLVQDYLSLVRVSAIQRDPVDLKTIVMQFAQEITPMLTARSIALHLDGLDLLGTVALHPNTFRRVLLNLAHNAMDAMPQGGTLTFHGQRNASMVQLDVRDTGVGIPPEHYAQIFEPLHTTKPGGTGLGLYIVQEVLAAHGGQVAVQSTVGHGTTFTITLPLVATEEATQHAPAC